MNHSLFSLPRRIHNRAGPLTCNLFAALLPLTFLSSAALAYEPNEGHRKLTQAAFEVLEKCKMPLSAELKQQVMAGNLAMDKGAAKLPDSLMDSIHANALYPMKVRVHNWHFYHPDKTSDAERLSGKTDMSMARLWQAGQTGLATADNGHKGYYLGALLHLIQDVTVPAHTTPVYHGPKIIAWKGEFAPLIRYLGWRHRGLFLISDPIDKWPVVGVKVGVKLGDKFDAPCPAVIADVNDETAPLAEAFDTLRETTSRQTLSALDAPIQGCGEPWGIFWRQNIGHRYFSGYNQALKPFDKEGDFVFNGKQCTPDYQSFVAARHQAAVDASVAALALWLKESGALNRSGS
ncbi:hypothetical protein KJI95_04140 [Shewanella sp. JM162201]|uniref:S1/P1 Nuclease n=1 Tax=Shewanella jiangmenensis TaxID=2837387 RepID=A0ABS5UZW2_9GAMM|nr:hypothetical protein [Shewanella jiangmenensis]MBT1443715.1 hypothetical protein [Shewanella jiangmenensis]